MKRITQYESAKLRIDQLKIKDLSNYEVGKILYTDIWGMYALSLMQKIKRVMALMVCNPLHLSRYPDYVEGKDIALEIHYTNDVPRADNATIYNNVYEYLKPARHVLLEKKYKIQLSGILRRLVRLFQYASSISGFAMSERLYLAAQLVMIKGFIEHLDATSFFKGSRYLLIFQEHDTISNAVIQNAHTYGVKVISPQHGMPMNRHEGSDQMIFDGFQCDYKLVWNDFAKAQFLSAGIDKNKIFVVGNTKNLYATPTNVESGSSFEGSRFSDKPLFFGVLLNYPKNDRAFEYNCMLLSAAVELAKAIGMAFCVKPHPADSVDRYEKIMKSGMAEIIPASVTMHEYQQKVLFSIAHVTGAIFDLIYDGCFVFQYIMGENFPVDIDDIYKFSTPEELIDHFLKWKANYNTYATEYQKIVDKYYISDVKERHDNFFIQLFAGELEREAGALETHTGLRTKQ